MILRELYYFDKQTMEPVEDQRYNSDDDTTSVVAMDDTRKTRLTLQQINRARKASELHDREKANEVEFVRQMYGMAAIAAASGEGGDLGL